LLHYRPKLIKNQHGMTLMIVLVMIVVTGLAAGMTGSTWKTVVQRAKEKDLLWCGDQYRRAIESFYQTKHKGPQADYPSNFEDLVKDPRFLHTVRHIRKIYKEPMTGKDWIALKDPSGKIIGVRSSSHLEPFKKDDFSKEYETFKEAKKYSDWEFVYKPGREEEKKQSKLP